MSKYYIYKKDELYHHGIEGQKWGIRNGPPYPLDQSSVSSTSVATRKVISDSDWKIEDDSYGGDFLYVEPKKIGNAKIHSDGVKLLVERRDNAGEQQKLKDAANKMAKEYNEKEIINHLLKDEYIKSWIYNGETDKAKRSKLENRFKKEINLEAISFLEENDALVVYNDGDEFLLGGHWITFEYDPNTKKIRGNISIEG